MPAHTLLVVVAHPDDESFGCGALIAGEAARGVDVVVASASRGELGEDASGLHPSPAMLGAAREVEMRRAARVLGASRVEILGLGDSGWDGEAPSGSIVAEPERLRMELTRLLEAHRPDVVVTMDPSGSDGHRDHAAVAEATTAVFGDRVDWPAALYHWCMPHSIMDDWLREIAAAQPDSVYAGTDMGRPDDHITTIVDGTGVAERVWRAIAEHATQDSPFEAISAELAHRFVAVDHLVRIHPAWPGGPHERALCYPSP
ncbi:hypothetical protein GCG21_15500 [Pseudactinotalea sp. HY160]|uniref:PIG-L deacetylase family protein n=1 Tax=Pseudactinotalea sp. HY160 TaxID=2654490 RepID=UPI00128BB2A8|nr:PIG-L family deacetylase [Pseudactinotalea sp. HY160]MPV51389.1 hypothetical protein [Pseudactinotalea sp. HY160]